MNGLTKIIRGFPGTENITLTYHVFTNCYLIESEIGLMVVDTGISGNTWKILRAVKRLGYQPNDLTMVVLTHAHLDHFGCAAPLKAKTGAQVLGHCADVEHFEKGGIGAMPGFISGKKDYNVVFQGKFLGAPPVKIDKPLEDGDRLGEWEVIHTPGHTPGTISLFSEKRGVLITGGWAIPGKSQRERNKYKNPFVGYISSNPDQLHNSRMRLAKLNFDTLLCSHFPPRLFPFIGRQLHAIAKESKITN
jgi:glyoxylase-like metal-dependent hydrolase (beta-lactamase superfamily II)